MPEENKGLVDVVSIKDAEDSRVKVTDIEVVALGVAEEEEEEEEDVVPSFEAPFLTVKMSLTAS